MYRLTETVKHLIIVNVLMFIGTLSIGGGQLFYQWFALYFPKNDAFQPWQIITHMFMHGNLMHIFFNMFALWMFGTAVEQRFGSKKFLFFYLSSGLGAALIMLGFYFFKYVPLEQDLLSSGITSEQVKFMLTNNKVLNTITETQLSSLQTMFEVYNASMVGASGAIMGVLVAFGMLYPESKLMLIFLPIPIKAKYFIPGIIILDLISAITGQSFFSPSNTAYVAHVGGALTGFLIMWYWKKTQFNRNRWDL
ncbi:MAG TPA: rhomboid family intramembrane serine protease [Flavobacteriaceae bacterium]|nr:rhomboid family intramembrane serine protease [Flavobacteriaceae bacterium]